MTENEEHKRGNSSLEETIKLLEDELLNVKRHHEQQNQLYFPSTPTKVVPPLITTEIPLASNATDKHGTALSD